MFSGLLVVVMTILGTVDVVGRFFFDQPLQGQVELARVLMAFMVFLGLAEAQRQGQHVRIELLDNKLPPSIAAATNLTLTVIALLTVSVVTYATGIMFWQSWVTNETMMAAITLPTWPAKFALMFGFALYTIELAFDLTRKVTGWNLS